MSFMCVIGCNEIEWLYIFMRVNFKRSFSFNDFKWCCIFNFIEWIRMFFCEMYVF